MGSVYEFMPTTSEPREKGTNTSSLLIESIHLFFYFLESMRCRCGQQMAPQTTVPPPPADPQSIDIYGSHLNCVIIGDDNSMEVNQPYDMETEITTEEQSTLH